METTYAVANEFLKLAGNDLQLITHMKLQKLVYFSHGWHLGLEAGPLINEPVRAWHYGPIFISLYYALMECGNESIDRYIKQLCYDTDKLKLTQPKVSNKFANEIIERIWEIYGQYTGVQLSNLAHSFGTPWEQISSQYPGGLSQGINIPDELIYKCFKKLKSKNI